MTADFLIVGGGIGGAVLAELLGRAGRKVVVLEKSTSRPTWTRPEILWPATVDLLFSLAPREAWEREAMLPLRGIEFFDGERFTPGVAQEQFTEAHVQPWSTDPNATRELLLGLSSFELHRGVEVTEVLKEKERVVGVRARRPGGELLEVLAAWTIGDDGVNSIVRRACGIGMSTRLFPVEFLAFKFDWPPDFPPAVARVVPNFNSNRSGLLALGGVPVPSAKGAGLIAIHGKDYDANPSVADTWQRFRAANPVIEKIIGHRKFLDDFARIKRPWGHAERYGAPGAVLMGDAAHSVSPAGGQGANMSVADARALAELLLCGAPNLVETYERRRRPANACSMRPTRR